MRVVHDRCCGLDVHKKSLVACVITPEAQHTKTFGTMTGQLLALADWLQTHHVTHVAMESTGVYWKPVYNLLEDTFSVYVVNAHHVKAVPGRKTDVKDAEWIAELLKHGLLRPQFHSRPPAARIARVGCATVKAWCRSAAASPIAWAKCWRAPTSSWPRWPRISWGASGRLTLHALAAGEQDPEVLAQMAKGRLRDKLAALQEALSGLLGSHQRFLLGVQLRHLESLEGEIEKLDAEVARRVEPHDEGVQAVDTIPGIGRRTAEVIVAEMGTDMDRFPTPGHLASGSGVCPGNNRSADKSRRSPTKKGNPSLRSALVEAARSAARTKTYLGAQYRRLSRRIGANRAAMAVAHSIIKTKQPFADLGPDYFAQRDKSATIRRAVRQLERLGHNVSLEAA